jgi:cytochrome oxidase Cu insertion factor (SCO1/SenC/PrrC family)
VTDEPTAPPAFDVSRVLVWCAIVAVVAGVVGAAFLLPGRDAPPQAPAQRLVEVPEDGEDPPPPTTGLFERPVGEWIDVPATERSGLEFRTADVLGKWIVVDFVFASCGGTCPRLQAAMRKLHDATAGDAGLRFVSVSVDPVRDTPEKLAAWADAQGADRSRWLYLRIAETDLRRFMKDGLKVPTPDDLVMHSNLFLLVGPDGRVHGRYAPLDHANWMEVLRADLAIVRAPEQQR